MSLRATLNVGAVRKPLFACSAAHIRTCELGCAVISMLLRNTYGVRDGPDLAKDRRGKLRLCKERYGCVTLDEARVGRISEGEVVGKGQALGWRQLEGWSCAGVMEVSAFVF